MEGEGGGELALDRGLLKRVKGIYFSFYPTQEKALTWKDCVKEINRYLRWKVNNPKSSGLGCLKAH